MGKLKQIHATIKNVLRAVFVVSTQLEDICCEHEVAKAFRKPLLSTILLAVEVKQLKGEQKCWPLLPGHFIFSA